MTAYNGGSAPPIAWASPPSSLQPYIPSSDELDLQQQTEPANPTGAEPKATSNTVLITFHPATQISNGDSIKINNDVNTIPSYTDQTFSIDQILNDHSIVITFNNPPIQNYATEGILILKTTFTNCLKQGSYDVGKGAGNVVVEGGKTIKDIVSSTTSGLLSSLGISGFIGNKFSQLCIPLCFCIIFIFIIFYIMKRK
jgi:hypothetical protein